MADAYRERGATDDVSILTADFKQVKQNISEFIKIMDAVRMDLTEFDK
jgi:hypothetical protein